MNSENKIPNISFFGSTSVILFILFSIAGGLTYPFGDEPDFTVRAPALILGEHSIFSPYYWLNSVLSTLEYRSFCKIQSTPLSLIQTIDAESCRQSLVSAIKRLFITVVVFSPILIFVTFRKFFVQIATTLGYTNSTKEWGVRLDSISLTLLFPGFLYYSGVLAEEQLVLMLALLIFLFWGKWLIPLLVTLLIIVIDIGNGIVVSYFLLLSLMLLRTTKKSIKATVIYSLLITSTFIFLGFSTIELIAQIPFFSEKANSILYAYTDSEVLTKYPIFIRPIITLMSFIFLTPAYVKSLAAYFVFFTSLFYIFSTYLKKSKTLIEIKSNLIKKEVLLISSILTILTLLIALPNYSHGKYYIFLLPFFLVPMLIITRKNNIRIFIITLNLIILVNINFYYWLD